MAGDMNDLYETDIVLWSERQTELLRRRAAGELVNDGDLDWPNLAEEIEAVGASARRELRTRLARLVQHLLKWQYQTDLRSRSWRATIRNQRYEISDLLQESPSLRSRLPEIFPDAYRRGRADALDETGLLDLPDTAPFTIAQALGDELPD
jgi:hypothetical protein